MANKSNAIDINIILTYEYNVSNNNWEYTWDTSRLREKHDISIVPMQIQCDDTVIWYQR